MEPAENANTIPLEQFWEWLCNHPNCVVRAGTSTVVMCDLPELHWHMFDDMDGSLVVQLVRGKDLVSEMHVPASEILFVQATAEEEGNVIFELITGSEDDNVAAFHFLMAHGMDSGETPPHGWTH